MNHGTHNRFDHNVFRDTYRYSYNGQENLQVASSNGTSNALTLALIEYNLFDNAWGDGETISDKASGNVTRHNVAAHNRGAFTYRVGHSSTFEGNVIVDCAGGLRAYDADHTIINNLIVDCGYGIYFGGETAIHQPVSDSLVANNTIVNCSGDSLYIGTGDPARRFGNRYINNLLVSNIGQLIGDEVFSNQTAPVVDNNLLWATGSAATGPTGTNPLMVDPQLTTLPGLTEYINIRPAKTSPVIDAGAALPTLTRDRWQVGRPIASAIDIGADEIDANGDFATSILLPFVPPVRVFDYDDYKHAAVSLYDADVPLSDWVVSSGASASNGVVELTDTSITLSAALPPSVCPRVGVPGPTTSRLMRAVAFSRHADGRAYRLGVGGSATVDKPASILTLDKDGFGRVLECPDIQYHFFTYADRTATPDPARWYKFRLLKIAGRLRLEMNCEKLNGEIVPGSRVAGPWRPGRRVLRWRGPESDPDGRRTLAQRQYLGDYVDAWVAARGEYGAIGCGRRRGDRARRPGVHGRAGRTDRRLAALRTD